MTELNLCATYSDINKAEFIVDAVLFDMDGTLIDSIPAIESAWAAVAKTINRDPQEVIDETHGRRVMDNLRDLKPQLRKMSDVEMGPHVKEFELEVLRQADEYGQEVRSRKSSAASSRRASRSSSPLPSQHPNTENKPRTKSGLCNSVTAKDVASRMGALGLAALSKPDQHVGTMTGSKADFKIRSLIGENAADVFDEDDEDIEVDVSDLVDCSVRILPGVRKFTQSLPADRWAIATSAAVTHCFGALERVGISLPKVTVTADDPALKKGKPFPDPFNLAAEKLGFEAKNCLVVEDSPFGIQAGVATGGKTIAVGTSHPHEKIEHCGSTWLLPTLELVQVEIMSDGRIKIKVDATKEEVEKAHALAVPTTIPPIYMPSSK
ncbi:HAD-like domain-containing protein [Phakopsora pachyrhizi]|uniref:HAD-like domain-containing protein n=1 Tax=Phakopsora pachyrhizi TaxID=170000 RepID=A0AAV0BRE5_PHAPC|nr:HAD-like domain-containing protein [Phakopsora pachyrhizi]CAH7689972.1 HAD-like domain-containing protein [Phakopsora pachyrhizi]